MSSLKSNVILYIHGLGSSCESPTYYNIKEFFEPYGYKVITETFNLNRRPNIELSYINNLIKTTNAAIVIASSLGGFYLLLSDTDAYRIVINPCMKPSIELVKRNPRCKFIQELFKTYESSYKEYNNVFGIFGSNDELFSYLDSYKALYRDSFVLVLGKHRLEKESLYEALNAAISRLKIS